MFSETVVDYLIINVPFAGIVILVGHYFIKRSDRVLSDIVKNHRDDNNKHNEKYLALMEKTVKLLERQSIWIHENKRSLERIEHKMNNSK